MRIHSSTMYLKIGVRTEVMAVKMLPCHSFDPLATRHHDETTASTDSESRVASTSTGIAKSGK